MTPESKVKRTIATILRRYAPDVYYLMPVPGGYGRSGLDYLGCCCGLWFSIEAKRLGRVPTERQQGVIEDIEAAGGKNFVIDGPAGLEALDQWLTTISERQK